MRTCVVVAATIALAIGARVGFAQDVDQRAKALFDDAVQLQQARQYESAIAAYRQVLELKPKSASTLNNLGQAYAALGRVDDALQSYRGALDVADDNQLFYRKQYADLLWSAKREPEAVAEYRKLNVALPGSAPASAALTASYSQDDPSELVGYLWELVDAGEVLTAAETALTSLEAAPERAGTADLLAIVARALGQETLTAAQAAPLRERLRGLESGAAIGPGAKGIAAAYQSPKGSFAWWAERGSPLREAPQGMWPRDAFRYLLRSLGAAAESGSDFATAEAYFFAAAELSSAESDPLAFQALCKLYLREGDAGIAKIQQLVTNSRYVDRLFQGKGDAYRLGQVEKIYKYHVTLGYIYGTLARQNKMPWGDRFTAGSAVYQLEHARSVGEMIDSDRGNAPGQPAHVDVGVVDLLSEYYGTQQNAGAAEVLRVDAAQRLLRGGDQNAASQVLRPVSNEALRQRNATLYRDLRAQ